MRIMSDYVEPTYVAQSAAGIGSTQPSYAPATPVPNASPMAPLPSYAPATPVAMGELQPLGEPQAYGVSPTVAALWGIASVASSGACAYHGYKRNNSVGWAVGWAVLGGLFPIVAPAIAVAQGFGQRAED